MGRKVASFQCLVFREERKVPSEQRAVSSDQGSMGGSGVGEFAFGFEDGASEGFCGFDPLGYDGLGVGDGFLVGGSVGHTAGEFRSLRREKTDLPCSSG